MNPLFQQIWTLPVSKVPPPYERGLKVVLQSTPDHPLPFTALVSTIYPEGGKTALHTHPDHGELMYVVSGRGRLLLDGVEYGLEPDILFYAPPGVAHQLSNHGQDILKILCVFTPGLPDSYIRDMQAQATQTGGSAQ